MTNWLSGLFWKLKPLLNLVDKLFTVPFSIKKVNGDHYYKWRDKIEVGAVLLTDIQGVGSNLINPAAIKHGAIYFGKGLRSTIESIIESLEEDYELYGISSKLNQIVRLKKFLNKNDVDDEICYVIEAVGKGVVATNLVKFITTKDRLIVMQPKFDLTTRRRAANLAVFSLGLPYDYGFNHDEKAKYCFEVVADSYESAIAGLHLKRSEWFLFRRKIFEAFMAESFLESEDFQIIIDSDSDFK
jgi:hypothetical protein